jgi:uroporphyrinogen III methyltransferase/synthase
VHDVAVYETRPADSLPPYLLDAIDAKRVTWITFTSSSTAKNFAELLGSDYRTRLAGIHLASIGPITSSTLRQLGLPPSIEAEKFNIDGLVESILAKCSAKS